jgi:predicted acyltransferase
MTEPSDVNSQAVPPPSERLVALDVVRGMTIAGMILVNNPGDWSHVFPPLRHAEWHGFTPTDLVFPSFLLIVGAAIPFALGNRIERGDTRAAVLAKVLRRSALIFAIGLFLNGFPFQLPLAKLRIPGVLQRIALCYLAAALLYLATSIRAQLIVAAGLLLGYWALMTLVPVPGYGAGDLSRPHNLAAWVDRGVMPGHLYKRDYDPEGLLSTIPAIATTLIGVVTGAWLRTPRPARERFVALCAAALCLLLLGLAWGQVFPINKALWTSSFVLYAAGWSLLVLGVTGLLIDVQGYRLWTWPFVVLGSNAIAAYTLSSLTARILTMVKVSTSSGESVPLKSWLYESFFTWWTDPTVASLLFGVSYVLFWLSIMAVFYRLKLFIRL